MARTPLTSLLARATLTDRGLALDVPDDWMQGRSVFGGLQAAFAVRAMRTHVAETPLRTLQVTFVGPVAGAMRAETTVLRTGSNATHVEARLFGADGLATIAIGVFGKPRTSAVAVAPAQPPLEAPAQPFELPYIPGVVPTFIQHFRVRWLRGIPFSGDTSREHVLELALHDDGPATEAHVIAFADVIPPIALSFLENRANGSTLTWMLELLTDRFDGLAGWRVDAELIAARDGYTNQSLVLWAPDGSPVALGRQTMLVFG